MSTLERIKVYITYVLSKCIIMYKYNEIKLTVSYYCEIYSVYQSQNKKFQHTRKRAKA